MSLGVHTQEHEVWYFVVYHWYAQGLSACPSPWGRYLRCQLWIPLCLGTIYEGWLVSWVTQGSIRHCWSLYCGISGIFFQVQDDGAYPMGFDDPPDAVDLHIIHRIQGFILCVYLKLGINGVSKSWIPECEPCRCVQSGQDFLVVCSGEFCGGADLI